MSWMNVFKLLATEKLLIFGQSFHFINCKLCMEMYIKMYFYCRFKRQCKKKSGVYGQRCQWGSPRHTPTFLTSWLTSWAPRWKTLSTWHVRGCDATMIPVMWGRTSPQHCLQLRRTLIVEAHTSCFKSEVICFLLDINIVGLHSNMYLIYYKLRVTFKFTIWF